MWCYLCQDRIPDVTTPDDAIEHVRRLHPAHYREPERWPDGALVELLDPAVEPGDFA